MDWTEISNVFRPLPVAKPQPGLETASQQPHLAFQPRLSGHLAIWPAAWRHPERRFPRARGHGSARSVSGYGDSQKTQGGVFWDTAIGDLFGSK